MSDLISRQAAIEALQEKVFHDLSDEFYGAMQVLDELPPADRKGQIEVVEDVAPVIHAHWIEEEDCTAVTDIPWSMCSACGSYSLKLPYCAFCGAKMDEEQ